jgi:membrane glycosyltransferase
MTRDNAVRTQISALIFTMTNAVLFGAGLIAVLMVPALNANAGFWIAAVVVASLVLAAPFSWLIAPRLRARYWRKQPAQPASQPTRAF